MVRNVFLNIATGSDLLFIISDIRTSNAEKIYLQMYAEKIYLSTFLLTKIFPVKNNLWNVNTEKPLHKGSSCCSCVSLREMQQSCKGFW